MSMILQKGYKLYDKSGRNVLDIRDRTEFGAFRQREDCVIESPARFGGGAFNVILLEHSHM